MKKYQKILEKLRNRYKLILYNDSTLREVTTFYLTRLNVFAFTGLFIAVIVVVVIVLFIFTPLNAFLPAYSDSKLKRELIESAIRMDSIEYVLKQRETYFAQIRNVMDGKDYESYTETDDTTVLERQEINFTKSKHDSLLRLLIEEEEATNLSVVNSENTGSKFNRLHFFMPVKGLITSKFEPSESHFGIDIVAKAEEPILATLNGTVIMATWSLETGYVIQIQHEENLISMYKHNSALLKKVGDHVKAGETIAIIGNTGEMTTGPHLHFEIWHNGVPINPEDYIAF